MFLPQGSRKYNEITKTPFLQIFDSAGHYKSNKIFA